MVGKGRRKEKLVCEPDHRLSCSVLVVSYRLLNENHTLRMAYLMVDTTKKCIFCGFVSTRSRDLIITLAGSLRLSASTPVALANALS